MRRKSEKKLTDASTSAPARRTSRRSKKSPVCKQPNQIETKNAIPENTMEEKELSSGLENKISQETNETRDLISIDSITNKNRTEILPQGHEIVEENVSTETESISKKECDEEKIQIFQSENKDTNPFVSGEFSDTIKTCSEFETTETEKESNENLDHAHMPTKVTSKEVGNENHESLDSHMKASEISVTKRGLHSLKGFKTESLTSENVKTKKRKWLSKNSKETKDFIMSISTDSLKNLISDVHPVPLSDIKLESSSEVEEVCSEKIEESNIFSTGQHVSQGDREQETKNIDELQIYSNKKKQHVHDVNANDPKLGSILPLSPPKNELSTVLFITNLVRPFTILQLKGLLARTGRITPGGFWIDRIKSKCYVRYETEDEAIETRHALHGVRWPASNPKCLNVDFGDIMSLEKAITSTRHETPTFGQDSHSENRIVGTGWDREFDEEKVQVSRPVREWDVGKKDDFDKDSEKSRVRERSHAFEREDRSRRRSLDKIKHCCSLSPDAKKTKKKENDPPLRLLDDLFRKTMVTPCIYWLPLTPEQIAEKEAFRLKRINEHHERMKQRELDREKILAREKERAKEKDRQKDRDKDKEKERKRDRSDERRKSRSRDRRRY